MRAEGRRPAPPDGRPAVLDQNSGSQPPHAKARPMRLSTSLPVRLAAPLLVGLGALLAATGPLAAQASGTIKGSVTQSGNGHPLAGVIVTVAGTGDKAVNTPRGAYTIERVAEESHTAT